jgi:hypothetical protein
MGRKRAKIYSEDGNDVLGLSDSSASASPASGHSSAGDELYLPGGGKQDIPAATAAIAATAASAAEDSWSDEVVLSAPQVASKARVDKARGFGAAASAPEASLSAVAVAMAATTVPQATMLSPTPHMDPNDINGARLFGSTGTVLEASASVRPLLNQVALAVEASRLSMTAMSEAEKVAFPDTAASPVEAVRFLRLRNKLLYMWHWDCHTELTEETAIESVVSEADFELTRKILRFLTINGHVNFGLFRRNAVFVPDNVKKTRVIVIGAGMAGISAARQLVGAGFEVVMLEGRERIGGRIHSKKWGEYIVDLGAMVVTGLGNGNPVTTLAKQMNIDLYPIRSRCPLYDSEGNAVSHPLLPCLCLLQSHPSLPHTYTYTS